MYFTSWLTVFHRINANYNISSNIQLKHFYLVVEGNKSAIILFTDKYLLLLSIVVSTFGQNLEATNISIGLMLEEDGIVKIEC